MVAIIIIFPGIVSYGDPAERARIEQSGDVDLSTLMQPGEKSGGGEQKDASEFLKQLQQADK
jgi:hypothetical protein